MQIAVASSGATSAGGAKDEKRESFRRIVLLRLVIACVLAGAGLLILNGGANAPLFPLAVILCGSVVVTPLFLFAQGSGSSSSFLVAALTTLDLGLETVLVHHTGGAFSQLTLLYVLSIVSASLFYQMRGTLTFATLAAAGYMGVVWAEGTGLLAPSLLGAGVPAPGGTLPSLHVALNVVTFYLVAFLSGQLSVKVERRRRLLETATEELRATRFDTDQILQNLSSGLITVDREGRILNLNRAGETILRLSTAQAAGAFHRELLGKGGVELSELFERTLKERSPMNRVEVTLRREDGTAVPVGVSTSLLGRGGSEGEVRAVVALFQDLTEARRIDDRLRRADRLAAIGELAAGIAHEIRNPLASISGAAEILSAELRVAGEEERLLRLVVRESDRLNRFVGDFLAYTRSRPRRVSLVPVEGLLEDVKLLTASHPKFPRGIEIELSLGDGDHFIEADAEEIKRVFLNLAQNAVEAMGTEGRLTIEVRGADPAHERKEDGVTIRFRDTGPGLPEGSVSEIFKPFVTGKKGGTGLGLAIAQKIVEEHRGEIRCEKAPASGAVFVVRLPGVFVPDEAIVVPS